MRALLIIEQTLATAGDKRLISTRLAKTGYHVVSAHGSGKGRRDPPISFTGNDHPFAGLLLACYRLHQRRVVIAGLAFRGSGERDACSKKERSKKGIRKRKSL